MKNLINMLNSGMMRYCIYGTCAIISSELLYHSYCWVKNWFKERSLKQEVYEVIWTNELTQSCAVQHRSEITSPSSRSLASSPARIRTPLRHFVKHSTPLKWFSNVCCNPYCSAYNIGRLIEYIDSAQYSIDLAMYTFTSYDVLHAFLRALRRGVFIRIISDQEMVYSTGSQIVPLTKAGVPVRCNRNTNDLMHHKFCLIDSPTRVASILEKQNKTSVNKYVRSLLMTGSLNWTNQGFSFNWENILITSNQKYIEKYSQEFERLWKVFNIVFE